MGKKLGLGLGFVLADSFSLLFISFFSFNRMEKLGLGLGFDPSSFFPSSIPSLDLILGIRVRS